MHLSESYPKRNPDIYTAEDNCPFTETSIEKQIQKLVPSRLSKSKFILPMNTKDVRKLRTSGDKLYVRVIKSKSPHNWNRF